MARAARNHLISPMLAHVYRGATQPGDVYVQPKLDGVRAIANAHGLWSRHGLQITSCRHIEEALSNFFVRYPNAILDGELYNHELRNDLNAVISLVNTRSPDEAKRHRAEQTIQFHIFDVPSHPGLFSARLRFLEEGRSYSGTAASVHLVTTTRAQNRVHLDELFAAHLADGYEGQMIRADAAYESGRSMRLLKRKPFMDAEFDVVRIHEVHGSVTGFAKRVLLRHPNGRVFGAAIKGSREFATSLLRRSPGSATVRFAASTPSGLPRSPVAVAFHDSPRI